MGIEVDNCTGADQRGEVGFEATRFSELEKFIPDVTQKMLIQQLKGLQQDDIVHRTVYPEVPPRVEYALTELGHALAPTMTALIDWAELRHLHHAKRVETT